MKYRYEVINHIVRNKGYKTYLEIGVKDALCFHQVKCPSKMGMDIKPLTPNRWVYKMSSDEFFASALGRNKYDIIFIDGDHCEAQVDRDIKNSLQCLAKGGTIVMHDCNPPKEEYASAERSQGQLLWTGTAYRSYLKLRKSCDKLNMCVVAIDWGCGIIQRGEQDLVDIPDGYSWDDFDKNRVEWLNLITVDEFERRFK